MKILKAEMFGIMILSPTYGYKPVVAKCGKKDELGKWYEVNPKALPVLEKAGFLIKITSQNR